MGLSLITLFFRLKPDPHEKGYCYFAFFFVNWLAVLTSAGLPSLEKVPLLSLMEKNTLLSGRFVSCES